MKSYKEFLNELNESYPGRELDNSKDSISGINIQKILNFFDINDTVENIIEHWNEPQRSYHSLNHLKDLLEMIKKLKIPSNPKDFDPQNPRLINNHLFYLLVLTAIYHDIIYDPKLKDNEEKSAEYFKSKWKVSGGSKNEIYKAILATKTHKTVNQISEFFNKLDMDILNRDYPELLKWETGIFNEYEFYGNENYKKGRLKFLESEINNYPKNKENLLKLIDYVKTNY